MKVGVVSLNYDPEVTGIGPYVADYAATLLHRGHQVTVLTATPHYPTWREMPWTDRGRTERVRRVRTALPRFPSQPVDRLRYELSFAWGARRYVSEFRDFNVLILVMPPLIATAILALWARLYSIPVVVVVQDIFSVGMTETTVARLPLVSLTRRVETWIFRNATLVIAVSDRLRNTAVDCGGVAARVRVLPNWLLDGKEPPDRGEARIQLNFLDDVRYIVHAGNMGSKQGLSVVIQCALLAAEQSLPWEFILVGDGSERRVLESAAAGMSNVHFWDLVSADRHRALLSAADALLLTQSAGVRDMSFPSKLAGYLRSGTPIVFSGEPDSAVGYELATSGAAAMAPAGRGDELLGAIASVTELPEFRRGVLANAARYLSAFDPDLLRGRFVELVETTGARA